MKPEEIQDRFVKVPLDLLRGDNDLDEYEKLVWIVLQSRADNKTGRCNPSIESIAADAGVKERTVYYAINGLKGKGGLVKKGWLKVTQRPGRCSEYCPLLPRVSRRLKSGDVSVPLGKEVPDCHTDNTPAPHAGVCTSAQTQTQSQTAIQTQPLHHMQDTPAPHAGQVLDSSSKSRKISLPTEAKRETSLRTPGTKAKDNDETCRFDSATGHFVVGQAVRLRLEADYPRIDYDKSLPLIEARLPRDKSGKATPIYNALPYLDSCFADFRNCVVKYGEEVRHTDGTVGHVKVYTDEESSLLYHAPLPELPLDSTFNQLVEEILAKRRDT